MISYLLIEGFELDVLDEIIENNKNKKYGNWVSFNRSKNFGKNLYIDKIKYEFLKIYFKKIKKNINLYLFF